MVQYFIGVLRLSLLAILCTTFVATRADAIEIREVTTAGGIKALLVEDYTLPIISMSFAFDGGSVQDPQGKEGLTRLMASLLDEGSGELDSASFRSKLEDNGIELGFYSSKESVSGSLRTLATDRKLAFSMLQAALTEPSFDSDAIERMRNAIRLGIVRSKTRPDAVASETLREILYMHHPYARSTSGKEETIAAITREDIVAIHRNLLARDNLSIGVVGAISEEDLGKLLDSTFGSLPEVANLQDIPEMPPELGETIAIEMPVPNASISLVYKGVKRDSPDFFAAYIMNHILGGGTFSSRLYEKVREERGLAYGVSSTLATLDHSSYLIAGTSTRAENRDEAVAVMIGEIEKLAQEGATEEELKAAKKYISGAYAINNLDSSGKIARVLVAIQSKGLGIDYIDKRQKLVDDVTLDDVNRLARELLSVKPAQVIVGPQAQ